MNTTLVLTETDVKEIQRKFILKVYNWMAFALAITGLVALFTINTPALLRLVFSNSFTMWGLLIGEILLVMYLSAAIGRMSSSTATTIFLVYAALNGITLSLIFLAYTFESIASTFFITAGTFALMSAYGYFTKTDLTQFRNLLFMALIGLIIASVVNMFLHNTAVYWITTYVGVLIFVGLTAYDTQRLKNMSMGIEGDVEVGKKAAIIGALALYLDFINLFLLLLRIFGRRD